MSAHDDEDDDRFPLPEELPGIAAAIEAQLRAVRVGNAGRWGGLNAIEAVCRLTTEHPDFDTEQVERPSFAMFSELSSDARDLGKLLEAVEMYAWKIQTTAQRAVRAYQQEEENRPVSFNDVVGHMTTRFEYLGGASSLKAYREQAFELIKILREHMSAEQIAAFLDGYHWEVYDTAPPALKKPFSSTLLRHVDDHTIVGRAVSPDDPVFQEDDVVVEGEPGDGKLLVLVHGGRMRGVKGASLRPGWTINSGRGNAVIYEITTSAEEGMLTVTFKDGFEPKVVPANRPIGGAITVTRGVWIPTGELERGRQRIKLLEDGREDDLRALVKRAADDATTRAAER